MAALILNARGITLSVDIATRDYELRSAAKLRFMEVVPRHFRKGVEPETNPAHIIPVAGRLSAV